MISASLSLLVHLVDDVEDSDSDGGYSGNENDHDDDTTAVATATSPSTAIAPDRGPTGGESAKENNDGSRDTG